MNMEDYFKMLNEAVERNARDREKSKDKNGRQPGGGQASRY